VVGLLAIELFLTSDGVLLVNELAPRPHNSGHYTLDACRTSQFEQHIRAVCGLPLGDVTLDAPVVMTNILGNAWFAKSDGSPVIPNWALLLQEPATKLHLYGKKEARLGRKMGHFSIRAENADLALALAKVLQANL